MRFRSNPVVERAASGAQTLAYDQGAMSISGTKKKTLVLLAVLFATSILGRALLLRGVDPSLLLGGSSLGGFVLAMMITFKPHLAPKLSIAYTGLEGILIGGLSLIAEAVFPGIALRAVLATFLSVIFTMLLYKEAPGLAAKIRLGVLIGMVTVLAVSLLGMVFHLMGMSFSLMESTPLGIGASFLVVILAILSLLLDYDNVVQGEAQGLPKQMEWYFAFGIMVTLVWLYIRVLNLLMKIASRSRR